MRVMTYNIRGGLGIDGQRSTDRIADVVQTWKPDIVCFQEVHQRLPWTKFINQPARLQRRLGMSFVFQPNVKVPLGGYGLGIATHYQVLTVMQRRLPSRGETRGALQVELDTPTGRLTVICTHWGLKTEERAWQAAQLGQWLGEIKSPVVLCGDLNDLPETQDIQEMIQRARLSDAGSTANAPTYPADAPCARIDVILHSPELRLTKLFVVEAQASDHYPVIADFALS